MRVLFVLPRMVSGGVERVTLNLIGEFKAAGHDCALALRRAHGELVEEAKALTEVHEIAPDGMHQFVPKLAALLREWRPTHVVTAFSDIACLTWLAMHFSGRRARWIHGVHGTHAAVGARAGVLGRLRHWVDRRSAAFTYRHASAVVAVSDGVRAEILALFRVDSSHVVTIYNPVVPHEQLRMVAEPRHAVNEPTAIAALGRLVRQKGFDVLIEAMAKVPMPWRLDIWGEGVEREGLQAQIDAAGLQGVIRLRGYTAEPYQVLRQADLFVLSSRHEGLPTVLVEALASQCQIIAADCPHGPREILLDGALGALVTPEDPSALAEAISARLSGASAPVSGEAMLQRAAAFTQTASAAQWLSLLRAA